MHGIGWKLTITSLQHSLESLVQKGTLISEKYIPMFYPLSEQIIYTGYNGNAVCVSKNNILYQLFLKKVCILYVKLKRIPIFFYNRYVKLKRIPILIKTGMYDFF